MIRLKINSRICHEKQALDLNQRQNLLDVEFALKLGQFTDILNSALIKLDFLVGHNATGRIADCCIVQTLCHCAQYFKNFFTLVMELIARRYVR